MGNNQVTLVNTSGTVSASAFVGDGSGLTNVNSGITDTRDNVKIGRSALASNQTWENTNEGAGYYNVAIGSQALMQATTGNSNVALGANAQYATTTGASNIALGPDSLLSNITGDDNIAIGAGAIFNSTGNSGQIAIGKYVLANAKSDITSHTHNIGIGNWVLTGTSTSTVS